MLKKANQKRRLDEMVIADGDFTTDYLQKLDWRDYLDDGQLKELGVDGSAAAAAGGASGGAQESAAEIRQALMAAEDEEDATAAKAAEGELQMDESEFNESAAGVGAVDSRGVSGTNTPRGMGDSPMVGIAVQEEEEEYDPLRGTIDGFMINFVESYFEQFD